MKRTTITLLLALVAMLSQAQWTSETLQEGRIFAGATGHQGKVYIAGGITNYSQDISTKLIEIYDNASGTWSYDSLSSPRNDVAVTSLGSHVIFAGGIDKSIVKNTVEIYNTQLQSWFYDTLVTPQGAAVAVSHGSKVYIAGGINNSQIGVTPNISIYDTLTGMWTADSLSVGRFGHAGAVVGELIIFAGGYTNTGTYPTTDQVDIYNTSTQTWSTATLSQKRGNMNALTVGNKVYFAGGLRSVSSGSLSRIVDIYDHDTQTWTTDTLSQGRRFIGIAQAGHKLLFAGGERSFSGNTPTDRVDVLDLITNTWSIDQLPVPHDAYVATQLPGKAFFIGGGSYSNGNITDQMDMYVPFGIGFEENDHRVEVYPNPCVDEVYVPEQFIGKGLAYEMYNIAGVKVSQGRLKGKALNLQDLTPGTYLMLIKDEEQVYKAFVQKVGQ